MNTSTSIANVVGTYLSRKVDASSGSPSYRFLQSILDKTSNSINALLKDWQHFHTNKTVATATVEQRIVSSSVNLDTVKGYVQIVLPEINMKRGMLFTVSPKKIDTLLFEDGSITMTLPKQGWPHSPKPAKQTAIDDSIINNVILPQVRSFLANIARDSRIFAPPRGKPLNF